MGMRDYMTADNEIDILLAARSVAIVRRGTTGLVSHLLQIGATSTPGLITIVVNGLTKVDRSLCESLSNLIETEPVSAIINMEVGFLQWGGRLEVLKWAREHGCPWAESTCAHAAKGGHLGY